jgi:LytR cell envelope-related transcriptional attenuator
LIIGLVVLAGIAGRMARPNPAPTRTGGDELALPPRGRVMVEVLNGTQRQGAARTATRMLRQRGLDVVFLGNADTLAESTLVVVRRGDPERARFVARAIGGGKVIVQTDTLRRVDISVILGEDFKPQLEVHP